MYNVNNYAVAACRIISIKQTRLLQPTFSYLPKYFVSDAKIQNGAPGFVLGKLDLPQPTFLHLPNYLLNQMQKHKIVLLDSCLINTGTSMIYLKWLPILEKKRPINR